MSPGISQQVGGSAEEDGVDRRHNRVGNVLRNHGLAQAVADDDHAAPAGPPWPSALLPLLECAPKSIRLAARLDDVSAIRQPVQQRLHSRLFGITYVHSENGRFVVISTAAFSARSATTWNRNSAPTSAIGT